MDSIDFLIVRCLWIQAPSIKSDIPIFPCHPPGLQTLTSPTGLDVSGLRFFQGKEDRNLTDLWFSQTELEIQPDSPIGLYVRRCRLHIAKLEFDQLSELAGQLKSFCATSKPHPDHFQSGGPQSIMTPSPGHGFPNSNPINHSLFAASAPPHDPDSQDIDPILQAYLECAPYATRPASLMLTLSEFSAQLHRFLRAWL